MFAVTNGLKKEISIPDALEILGLKFTGSYHRGGPDSFNAAKALVAGVFRWKDGYEDLLP
jgi:inhibitor of KinA sporulation pathway (predicted exonuclease)